MKWGNVLFLWRGQKVLDKCDHRKRGNEREREREREREIESVIYMRLFQGDKFVHL